MESGSLSTITHVCGVFREISDMYRRTLLKTIQKKKQLSHFKLEPDVYKHRFPEIKKRRSIVFIEKHHKDTYYSLLTVTSS